MSKETYGKAQRWINGEWVDLEGDEADEVNSIASKLGRGSTVKKEEGDDD